VGFNSIDELMGFKLWVLILIKFLFSLFSVRDVASPIYQSQPRRTTTFNVAVAVAIVLARHLLRTEYLFLFLYINTGTSNWYKYKCFCFNVDNDLFLQRDEKLICLDRETIGEEGLSFSSGNWKGEEELGTVREESCVFLFVFSFAFEPLIYFLSTCQASNYGTGELEYSRTGADLNSSKLSLNPQLNSVYRNLWEKNRRWWLEPPPEV
jgi:hypothetical protein